MLLTKVVVLGEPFQFTMVPLMKLEPVTESVKAAPGAVADAGLMEVSAGTELLTVKVWLFDVPLVFETVTFIVPAVVSWLAGIVAVSCVELTKVVLSAVPAK